MPVDDLKSFTNRNFSGNEQVAYDKTTDTVKSTGSEPTGVFSGVKRFGKWVMRHIGNTQAGVVNRETKSKFIELLKAKYGDDITTDITRGISKHLTRPLTGRRIKAILTNAEERVKSPVVKAAMTGDIYEANLKSANKQLSASPLKHELMSSEKAALHYYTRDEGCRAMNSALRTGKEALSENIGGQKEIIQAASAGLKKFPVHDGFAFRRLGFMPGGNAKEIIDRYQPGKVIRETAFTSTSQQGLPNSVKDSEKFRKIVLMVRDNYLTPDKDIKKKNRENTETKARNEQSIQHFVNVSNENSTNELKKQKIRDALDQADYQGCGFLILSHTGRKIDKISDYKGEQEVLFKPATRFKVLDRIDLPDDKNNKPRVLVIMEEMGDSKPRTKTSTEDQIFYNK